MAQGRMDASGKIIQPRLGTQEVFWVRVRNDTFGLIYQYAQRSATLRRTGVHCYLFVEDGNQVPDSVLDDLETAYDSTIYPTCRRYFGHEWNPGIDGDSLVTILLAGDLQPDYYFSPYDEMADSLAQKQNHHSNEREMFYIGRSYYSPGFVKGMMAHCQEHLIHWWQNPPGEAWLDEACALYATDLCGYGPGGDLFMFALYPNGVLTSWPSGIVDLPAPPESSASGMFYAFMVYLIEKYPSKNPGDPLIYHLVARRDIGLGFIGPGIGDIEFSLREVGYWPPISFRSIFTPWVIANFLDDTTLSGPSGGPSEPYGYRKPLGGQPHFVADPTFGPPEWFNTLPESVRFTLPLFGQGCVYVPTGKTDRQVTFVQDTFYYFIEGRQYSSFVYNVYLATSTDSSFAPGTNTLNVFPSDSTLSLPSNSTTRGAKFILSVPFKPGIANPPLVSFFAYAPLSSAETSAVNKAVYVYPNPFNPDKEQVHFRYVVTAPSKVDIRVYDASGNQVAIVADEQWQTTPAIYNSQTWDGKNYRGTPVANGVYFGRVKVGNKTTGVKIAVMR